MTEVVGSSSISKKTSDLDSAIWHLSSGNRLSSFVTYDGHSSEQWTDGIISLEFADFST
jgi:hypothetical protein